MSGITNLGLGAFPKNINRCGFVDLTETDFSFDEATGEFTLKLLSTTWSYYRAGIKYSIATNSTVTVASPMVNDTMYFIYIDSGDGALISSTSAWTLNDTKIPVATLYWNSTLTPKYQIAEERHTCLIDRRDHLYLHSTVGTRFADGATLTGPTVGSSVNSEKTVGISETSIFDEDLYQVLAAVSKGDGINNAYVIGFRTAATTWHWESSIMPFKYTGAGAIEYDNAGTMTAAGSGPDANTRWVNYYLCFSNVQADARVIFVPGRSAFTSAAAAYAEDFSLFDLTGIFTAEMVAIYQFTWDTNGSNLGLCRLARTPVRINTNLIASTSATTTDHSSLSGLEGGQIGEYYHATAAEYTILQATSGTNTGDQTYIAPRITSITSSAAPTPSADTTDVYLVTALATDPTFGAPTGSPVHGQSLVIRIKDDGTARTLAWNGAYRAGTDVALPTTTVISKTMYLGFKYNTTDAKWDLLALVDNI